jgi:DNA modification methylase
LWTPSDSLKNENREDRALKKHPSGFTMRAGRAVTTALERGGTTPFNVIPLSNADSKTSGGAKGHGAATPYKLCDWWIKYICPQNGTVLDPFCGSATIGQAAYNNKCNYIGFEKDAKYFKLASNNILKDG